MSLEVVFSPSTMAREENKKTKGGRKSDQRNRRTGRERSSLVPRGAGI
jgi:hypothetical protein